MKQNEILVLQGTDYKAMTLCLLEKAGLAELIPSKDTRIGLKPNLVSQIPACDGATTHPEVTAGVVEYLQSNGFQNIVILEGSWVGERTPDVVSFLGYDRLCEQYGVPFLDMQKDPGISADCRGMTLQVCKSALELGFLINLPVLKGHCQTRITCALKNMKGLLPNSEKRRFHRLGLHEPIGHLSAGIAQGFILADCICPDLTFEDGGDPVQINRLIAAADPVLCDAYGCSMLGIDPAQVPYIGIADKLGVGKADLTGAVVKKYVYEKNADSGMRPFDPERDPEPDMQSGFGRVMRLADNVEEVESCSACYGYLIPALEMLRKEGLLEHLHEKIGIGQGYRGKKGKLGVGNCTKGFECSLPGCPPTENQMADFLREYILENMPGSKDC